MLLKALLLINGGLLSNKKLLQDPEWLFTVLTALIKENGGELRIVDATLEAIGKQDIVGLYYDSKENCTVLKLVSASEILGTGLTMGNNDELDN